MKRALEKCKKVTNSAVLAWHKVGSLTLSLVFILPTALLGKGVHAQAISQQFLHSAAIDYVVSRESGEYYISVAGPQIGIWSAKNGLSHTLIELSDKPRYVTLSKDGRQIFAWMGNGTQVSYETSTGKKVNEVVFDPLLAEATDNRPWESFGARLTEVSPNLSKVVFDITRGAKGEKRGVGGIYVFEIDGNAKLIGKNNFAISQNLGALSYFDRLNGSPIGGKWIDDNSLQIFFNPFSNKRSSTKAVLDSHLKVLKYETEDENTALHASDQSNAFPKYAFGVYGSTKIAGQKLTVNVANKSQQGSGSLLESLSTYTTSIVKAELFPGGDALAIHARDNNTGGQRAQGKGQLSIYSLKTNKVQFRLTEVEDFAISKKGLLVVAGRTDVRVFNSSNGDMTCKIAYHQKSPESERREAVVKTSYDKEFAAVTVGYSMAGRGYPSLIDVEKCVEIMHGSEISKEGADQIEFIKSTDLLVAHNSIVNYESKKRIGYFLNQQNSPYGAKLISGASGSLVYEGGDFSRNKIFQWSISEDSYCRTSNEVKGLTCDKYDAVARDIDGFKLISSTSKNGLVRVGIDGSFLGSTKKNIVVSSDFDLRAPIRSFDGILNRTASYIGSEVNAVLPVVFSDGLLRIYRVGAKEPLLTITSVNSGDVMARTAEGYFASEDIKSVNAMGIEVDGELRGIVSFWDVFNRPDIVLARFQGESIVGLIGKLTLQQALKSPAPSVAPLAAPKADISAERIRIPYSIKSEGGGVGEVLVLHNGKLVKSDGFYKDAPGSSLVAINTTRSTSADEVAKGVRKMLGDVESRPAGGAAGNRDTVVVRQAKPKVLNAAGEFTDTVVIDVIPGEDNEITVMARNADNTILGQGQTLRFKSNLPKVESHLWLMPVGIATFQDRGVRKLVSPKKDALDFACNYGGREALNRVGVACDKPGYASGLFQSANIHVLEPLTNEKATRANILSQLDEIAAKAKPSDTFIWFVSSHGTMDSNSVYGLVPFDAKCQDSTCAAASGLVSSNDILEKSKAIKAMKQLLILDTCQAGGLDNKMSGLYDARMSGLAKNMGLHLYAAATATESALDGQDASKNSIFTAALLEGLAGASAKNTEGQISIIPLGQYVKSNTAVASRKAYPGDMPQTPVIQHFGKDAPLTSALK
jgi:hypothetical protein